MGKSTQIEQRGRRERRFATAIFTLVLMTFGALAGRLVFLQREKRPEYLAYAQRQQRALIPIPARRGMILDRAGRILAGSQESGSCFVDMLQLGAARAPEAAAKLAPILDLDPNALTRRLRARADRGHTWIKRRLDPAEAQAIRDLDIPGIAIENEPRRRYPLGTSMAHILGFVGADDDGIADARGMEGLELYYDAILQGEDGKKETICDVRRRSIWYSPESYVPPRDGDHLVLTLDAYIQGVAEEAIGQAVRKFQAESAVAVVMDPKTSEVLAMANVPTFDANNPNRLDGAPPKNAKQRQQVQDARRNRAITDPMEPGSAFKPFILAGALEQALTRPDEQIFCHNGLYVSGRRQLHDHHPYGYLSSVLVLAKSSNIGMGIIGERMGNELLHEYVRRFGFGAKTGIDLPGESAGMVVPFSRWTSYSTLSIPMGQEIATTAIQLANAMCALVNGGIWHRPKVVRKIVGPMGHVIDDRSTVLDARRVLAEKVALQMREQYLVAVVEEGTGRSVKLPKWQMCGKTGTAQVARQGGGGYQPDAYLSVFICAAPAYDPALVTVVMVRKPVRSIGYYGSVVAAPPAKEIMAKALAYLGVKPDPPSWKTRYARLAASTAQDDPGD